MSVTAYNEKMTIQEARDFCGDSEHEISDAVLEMVSTTLQTINNLCKSEVDNVWSENAMWAVVDVAFGDVRVEEILSLWSVEDLNEDEVKGNLIGAFLMGSKMDGDSLRTTADNHGMTDYLRHETALGDLSIDEWKNG